jgi:hypothetical protein
MGFARNGSGQPAAGHLFGFQMPAAGFSVCAGRRRPSRQPAQKTGTATAMQVVRQAATEASPSLCQHKVSTGHNQVSKLSSLLCSLMVQNCPPNRDE